MRARRIWLHAASILILSLSVAAQAQQSVLYSFGTNAGDGSIPNGGLVFDSAGNLYGTTQRGGANAGGTVFELTPKQGGGWSEIVIYDFCSQPSCADGGVPEAGLIIDSSGNLYGTAAVGGTYFGGTCGGAGCGTVYQLSPPSAPGGSWTQTVLWQFRGNLNNVDGAEPASRLNRDAAGNLYGTTIAGGTNTSFGTVFELTPNQGEAWSEKVLYLFCSNGPPCPDGTNPNAGVSFDASGNLYGTTLLGAFDGQWGTVYRLSPQPDGSWTETTLYKFTPETGGKPQSVVNFDQAGNLYGTVSTGGLGGPAQCGGVWRLTPHVHGIKEAGALLEPSGANGCGPLAGVYMGGKAKTVYATASTGGAFNGGTVFKATATKQTVIYEFCQQSGCADGSTPSGSLTPYKGAVYSTTSKGGAFNQGVVFKIAP